MSTSIPISHAVINMSSHIFCLIIGVVGELIYGLARNQVKATDTLMFEKQYIEISQRITLKFLLLVIKIKLLEEGRVSDGVSSKIPKALVAFMVLVLFCSCSEDQHVSLSTMGGFYFIYL